MDLQNLRQSVSKKKTQRQYFCRTCMSKEDNWKAETNKEVLEQSIHEFTKDNQTMNILELLTTTIPQLIIQATDDLPKKICLRCLQKLCDIHSFQQMCIASDYEIRCLYDNVILGTKGNDTNNSVVSEKLFELSAEDPLQDNEMMGEVNNYLKLEIDDCAELGTNENINTNKFSLKDTSDTENKVCVESINDEIKSRRNDETAEQEMANGSQEFENMIITQKIENISNEIKIVTRNSIRNIKKKKNTYDEQPKVYNCSKFKMKRSKRKKKNLEKIYECTICEIKFETHCLLLKHEPCKSLNKDEILRNKPHICEYCHKAFQQSCTLKDHIRTHTGEQPFLCSECGKAFNSSSNMKQHLLRHSGEKRYECPDCPKKFPCLSDLASHKAVHKKIKPHICDICGSAFGKPYQLKKHKMYHNGEKPHKCEYCEMRFVCVDHMRRHMRTHTGEKPYKCKYCTRAFAQSNDLIKHLRSHLGENVYQCELCPRAFRLAAELRIHFTDHKNDDEATRERHLRALMESEEKLKLNLNLK